MPRLSLLDLVLGLASSLVILILPGRVTTGAWPWHAPAGTIAAATAFALAHLAVVARIEWMRASGRTPRLPDHARAVLLAFGGAAIALLILKIQPDRRFLLLSLSLVGLLLGVQYLLPRRAQVITAAAIVVIGVAVAGLNRLQPELLAGLLGRAQPTAATRTVVDTAYYSLQLDIHDKLLDRCDSTGKQCRKPRAGGAIAALPDAYLIATGDGHLYSVRVESPAVRPATKLLASRVPLNDADFERDFGGKGLERFRVTGLIAEQAGDKVRLYAAHHHWKGGERCVVMRVSMAEADARGLLSDQVDLNWKTLYETQPCLPQTGPQFYGDESGGRLVRLGEQALLLSVGDFSLDGMTGVKPVAQDPNSSYGKTILIDLASARASTYSLGHRNPQGLHVDQHGTVWETEHGPKGGDELNIVVAGQNYGWPYVTYGTHALSHEWPLSIKQGEHDGYRLPVFAWLPDIAISNLISVRGDLFPRWRGDLIIGSYSRKLWRVRIRDGRVMYVEPINVRDQNARIRDIVEDARGRIALLIDGGAIAFVTPVSEEKKVPDGVAGSDSMRGQLIFAQCMGCHNAKDGTAHGIGPDLAGIAGRKIASAPGFTYSAALSSVQDVWTDAHLDRFLAAPQEFAPGTSMGFPGIAVASDRAKLIEYLKTLK